MSLAADRQSDGVADAMHSSALSFLVPFDALASGASEPKAAQRCETNANPLFAGDNRAGAGRLADNRRLSLAGEAAQRTGRGRRRRLRPR